MSERGEELIKLLNSRGHHFGIVSGELRCSNGLTYKLDWNDGTWSVIKHDPNPCTCCCKRQPPDDKIVAEGLSLKQILEDEKYLK